MEQLFDLWGLSLTHTLLLIAAILIVIDFFLPTDVPTHAAYIILCVLIAIRIEAHLLVRILAALLSWFALVGFHYCVWRLVMRRFANSVIAPDRCQFGATALLGCSGRMREVEGTKMVTVKGDLWPCIGGEQIPDGEKVRIVGLKDGKLEVRSMVT